LEADAEEIRVFDPLLIHGLLQTEDYAHAVIAGSGIELRTSRVMNVEVEFRMSRQQILHRDFPPRLWAVLGEATLRQRMGGAAVMDAQLERLLVVGNMPHISLQVLPFTAGAHPGIEGLVHGLGCRPGAHYCRSSSWTA
jgi:hypothetical protein